MFFLKRKLNTSATRLLVMSFMIALVGIMGGNGVFAAANTQTINSAVTAFQTISTLRREFPIDGEAIAAAYAGDLQALVQEIDETNGLELNNDLQTAINDIKNDSEPVLAAQVIDKTLQRVFYQIIWNRISTIRDEFETATSAALTPMLDEAQASFEAIKGTVARENQVLTADRQAIEAGSNPGLDTQINESFSRVRTALKKSNPAEDFSVVQVERYGIRISLARAYYIGVLREVSAIIQNRNTDLEEARIVQKEGEIFYRIIEALVGRDNPAGNLVIKSRLTGDFSDIDADEFVSELSKGLLGRVKGEMAGQETAVAEGDRPHAMAEAAGAKYYARIFLPDVEVRLGAGERTKLESELENFLTASSELDASKSATARDAILAILTNYESQLKQATYSISTDTAFVDNAVAKFQAIGELRGQDPIDGNAIATQYQSELQQLTQIVDQVYGLSIDADVSAAIESIKNQDQVPLAAQVIDKSLQRVFALVVYNRTTLAAENFDTLSADQLTLEWDRAYSAFQAIIGTASRENKVLTSDQSTLETGTDPDLDYQITQAFAQGKRSLDKANENDRFNLALARENVVLPLVRTFLIGVLREVEGIILDRNADVNEAREKQIEGEYFYRIIDVFIAQDNPTGHARIKSQLTGDMTTVVANEIVSDLSKGIIGQLKRNFDQITANFGVDKNQALLAFESAFLNASILQPDLELRLDVLQRTKLDNGLRNLKEAIQTEDATKALAAHSSIIEIISAYESELI